MDHTAKKLQNDRGRLYKAAATVCLLLALVLLLYPVFDGPKSDFELTVLDVGQGDSMLIRADGHNVLIDGGGQPADATAMAENVVLPYLRTQGIKSLDMVFNTHPDNDHIGGLFAVIDEVPTNTLGVYDGYIDSERQQQLLRLADQRNVTVAAVFAGQRFVFSDSFQITAISPQAGHSYDVDSYNEGSLVLHIEYQELDILATGDLNGVEMLDSVTGLDCTDIEVLQMPHHGSSANYNADWYANFTPQAVFICVGRDNKYGHPGQDVITYWQDRNVPVYRTDQNGACRIKYQNGSLSIDTAV